MWRQLVLIWVALVLLSLIFAPYTAHAVQLSETGCQQFAGLLRASAESRDVGADMDRYIAAVLAKNQAHASSELLSLIRAEVARVWASNIKPDDLYTMTIRRCYAARGDIGGES